jgi:hypothetical protein
LNGVFGSVNQGRGRMFQKRAFLKQVHGSLCVQGDPRTARLFNLYIDEVQNYLSGDVPKKSLIKPTVTETVSATPCKHLQVVSREDCKAQQRFNHSHVLLG